MRPIKFRLVVATATSPSPSTPMCPPRQGPQVGVETAAPALMKTSISPSRMAWRMMMGVAADMASKYVINYSFFPGKSVVIFPEILEFHFAKNTGMAFGLLQDLPVAWRTPFFSMITLIAVVIIVHLLRQAPKTALRFPTALGLILAGAFGNLASRFVWGYVVDFVKFYWSYPFKYWPIFNLADTFITIGITLLILDTILAKEEEEPATDDLEEATEDGVSALPETASEDVDEEDEERPVEQVAASTLSDGEPDASA